MPTGVEADDAHVVAQHPISLRVEMRSQGRLAGAGRTGEGDGATFDLDGAGMQRQEPALVAKHTQCGAQQEEPDVAVRAAGRGLDQDLAAGAHAIAPDLAHGEQVVVLPDLKGRARMARRRQRGRNRPKPNVDRRSETIVRPHGAELRQRQLGADPQSEREMARETFRAGIVVLSRQVGTFRA